MALVDVANRTLAIKIVYYGCAMGGKTTNLVTLHRLTDPDGQQGLVSIATNDDRTLFFDLLPMDLGQIGGLAIKVKLYTVPGQVHYELTRRQVLSSADGVVLVIDSSPKVAPNNKWAAENLRYNLKANGLENIPVVMQWNKRDLANALPIPQLRAELNPKRLPEYEAVATTGTGVAETFGGVLKTAIVAAYGRTGKSASSEQIDQAVDQALAQARSRAPAFDKPVATSFTHSFDFGDYRDAEGERGHDRRVVDQDSLLSEAVNTNMMLAEKLETLRSAERLGDRRGRMLQALSAVAPMLADPAGALPAGVMKLLLEGCGRHRGSLMLFRPGATVLDEREVIPAGPDPLNATIADGLGSLAYRIGQRGGVNLIEDLDTELFFGSAPPGVSGLGSALVAQLRCDSLDLGVVLVYGEVSEPVFDAVEREYWQTAASLVGLSLHWHALRRKLTQALAS